MFWSIRFVAQEGHQIDMGKPAARWSVRLMDDEGPAVSRLARETTCPHSGSGTTLASGAIQSDAIMLRIFVIGRGGFDLRASCFGRACANRRPSRR